MAGVGSGSKKMIRAGIEIIGGGQLIKTIFCSLLKNLNFVSKTVGTHERIGVLYE